MSRVQRANEPDIPGIVALNNRYSELGLTLKRDRKSTRLNSSHT